MAANACCEDIELPFEVMIDEGSADREEEEDAGVPKIAANWSELSKGREALCCWPI